jgi:hypothetical protein
VATTQQQVQAAIEALERDVNAAASAKDFARALKLQQQVDTLKEHQTEQPPQQDQPQQPQQPLPLTTATSPPQPAAAAVPPPQAAAVGSPDTPQGQESETACIHRLLQMRYGAAEKDEN